MQKNQRPVVYKTGWKFLLRFWTIVAIQCCVCGTCRAQSVAQTPAWPRFLPDSQKVYELAEVMPEPDQNILTYLFETRLDTGDSSRPDRFLFRFVVDTAGRLRAITQLIPPAATNAGQ